MSEQNRVAFEKWFVESIGELKYPESEPAILAKHNAKAGWNAATTESNKRIAELQSEVAAFEAISFVQMKQISELQASNNTLREQLETALTSLKERET